MVRQEEVIIYIYDFSLVMFFIDLINDVLYSVFGYGSNG